MGNGAAMMGKSVTVTEECEFVCDVCDVYCVF